MEEIKDNLKQVDAPSRGSLLKAAEKGTDLLKQKKLDDSKKWLEVMSDWIWEQLHSGHWKEVPVHYRRLYSLVKLLQAFIFSSKGEYKESLLCIDKGLLLGAPVLDEFLKRFAKVLTVELSISNKLLCDGHRIDEESSMASTTDTIWHGKTIRFRNYEPVSIFPALKRSKGDSDKFSLSSTLIETVDRPSLATFERDYMRTETPVVLSNCVNHWPAMKLWK